MKILQYLPSKKFILSFVSVVFAICIVIWAVWAGKNNSSYPNNLLATNSEKSFEAFKQIDTDKDGLPDWLESLYGTDPKKTDTDGDGTSDNDEVRANRDPLKANTALAGKEPNDKIDLAVIEAEKQSEEEYQKLNETEKTARLLLSDYLANQPTDRELTTDEINGLVNNLITNMPQKVYTGITKQKDIIVATKTNYDSLKIYGEAYIKGTEKLRSIIGTDVELLNTGLSTDQENPNIKKIKEITASELKIASDLAKVPAPIEVAELHFQIINQIENIALEVNDIADSTSDPARAMMAFVSYNMSVQDLLNNLSLMDARLSIIRY